MKKQLLLILSISLSSCALYALNTNTLKSSFSTNTKVIEPSALAFSLDKKSLLTVSDNNGSIYQLSLNGSIINELKTSLSDLEGITTHADLNGFCVVEERVRNVVCLDQTGKEIKRKAIPFKGESNSGFEGITYDSKRKIFYVINEKEAYCNIGLDQNLNIVEKFDFPAALDLSDIFYDESSDKFWLVSHESKEIYLTNARFQTEQKYSIPNIVQAEGISVDSINKKIYIISDKDSSFTVFDY